MNKRRTCIKCGCDSQAHHIKYNDRSIIFGDMKEWLELTCINCEYVWKEPTLDNKEKL